MVLNNVHGANICNKRGSLRHGNLPSMTFFGIGIDPLLNFLDKRPAGIPIASLSFLGPACKEDTSPTLPPNMEYYRVKS